MRNSFIFTLIFIISGFLYSQSKVKYYVEFKDTSSKPKFTQINDNKSLLFIKDNRFSVKSISKELESFENIKLKRTDIIEFFSEFEFMKFINSNRDIIYNYERIYEPDSVEDALLYTPNDYYYVNSEIAHSYLDLINAKEAWDYSKGDGVIVGVPDSGFRITHKEFKNKIITFSDESVYNGKHGNWVAGLVGAKTDNNFGNSSIGFNNLILATNIRTLGGLKRISDFGAKVINMSWYESCIPSEYYQIAINEIVKQGTVLVAAAGNNSTCGGPLNKIYPASYENVISVSGVGHLNEVGNRNTINVKDVHYYDYKNKINKTHHNEAVDIVAPSYDMTGLPGKDCDVCLSRIWTGTSFSSPLVAGTISLMFSANPHLSPIEIESILKMTSANIDQIAQNKPFAGKLGAGRLDAGKSTKVSKQMVLNEEISFSNKKFDRWSFVLKNSPYKINFKNYSFTGNSSIDFAARSSIVLSDNVLIEATNLTNHKLSISNSKLKPLESKKSINKNKDSQQEVLGIDIFPSIVVNKLYIVPRHLRNKIFDMKIYNKDGQIILKSKLNFIDKTEIDLSNVPKGTYFISINNHNLNLTKQIIKN